mmetsp:Transcript_26930/g.42078  ORF Transcript_26930/g.42078 Transcript_26930/m.42078 type:complete len:434 (-) Transcript_26930:33-1334(-)
MEESGTGSTCAFCFSSVAPLRCSACRSVNYCTVKCQHDDWERHKHDCTIGKKQSLPIEGARDQIFHDLEMNRVIFICGATGCGKSSQVPKMLYEAGMTVLCTQPRRLAVISVAKRVAEELEVDLGIEVGYHVGQQNQSSAFTDLLFISAGMLLEYFRSQGGKALDKYNVVVIDEVHERSVENDLILSCIKSFMKENKQLKLVIMSATAEFKRYSDYFSTLTDHLKMVAVDQMSSTEAPSYEVQEVFLEEAIKMTATSPNSGDYQRVLEWMQEIASKAKDLEVSKEKQPLRYPLGSVWLQMIADVAWNFHLILLPFQHILVFLPTYRAMETVHSILLDKLVLAEAQKLAAARVKLSVLHSTVDTTEAVESLTQDNTDSFRTIFLATNIAESSVTIPGLSHVIDSCLTNEIHWEPAAQTSVAKIAWSSQAQGTQR